MPHNDVPTLKVWKDATDRWFTGRSTLLKTLDTAIENFNTAPPLQKDAKRQLVADAWTAWRGKIRANPELTSAKRNGSKGLRLLERALIDHALIPDTYIVDLSLSRIPIRFLDALDREIELADVALPGVNLSGPAIKDVVDKGFAEALVALNDIVRRLDANAPDTQTMVKLWFGTTTTAVLATKFKSVRDHVTRINQGLSVPVDVCLKNGDAIAAAAPDAVHDHMVFYPLYFDTGVMAEANTYMFKRLTSKPTTIDYVRKWGLYNTAKTELELAIKRLTAIDRNGNNRAEIDEKKRELATLTTARIAENKMFEQDFRTRYGVVIHEFTHIVLKTKDVEIDIPKLTIDGVKVSGRCYGAIACSELAAYDPALALTNADNYRLFAETCRF